MDFSAPLLHPSHTSQLPPEFSRRRRSFPIKSHYFRVAVVVKSYKMRESLFFNQLNNSPKETLSTVYVPQTRAQIITGNGRKNGDRRDWRLPNTSRCHCLQGDLLHHRRRLERCYPKPENHLSTSMS